MALIALQTALFREPSSPSGVSFAADGFYQWQQHGKTKQPYCFEVNAGELFAFAGLWERWMSPQGEWIESCTILTNTPNSQLAEIHDRMPVILSSDNYGLQHLRDRFQISEGQVQPKIAPRTWSSGGWNTK